MKLRKKLSPYIIDTQEETLQIVQQYYFPPNVICFKATFTQWLVLGIVRLTTIPSLGLNPDVTWEV